MQATTMASGRSATMWLTREKDVVAHLFFAAAEIGDVQVDMAGSSISGTISFPAVELREFSFYLGAEPLDQVLPPQPGTVVRVRYFRGEAAYSFLTAVTDISDARRWRLEFPRTIERNDRRIAPRRRVMAGGGFRIRLDMGDGVMRTLPLFDLSAAGAGIIFNPSQHAFVIGHSLSGSLVLPGGAAVPVLVEISNLRDLPGGDGEKVAGCRFVGLAASDHGTLVRAMAESAGRGR